MNVFLAVNVSTYWIIPHQRSVPYASASMRVGTLRPLRYTTTYYYKPSQTTPIHVHCSLIGQAARLVNSNSLNSNFRITRVFLPVPIFFLHKVTKLTSDNSRLDNSRFRSIMSSWRCNFDIVDIAMWMMYTRYRVNIVNIDVLSCFTSSTSRCEQCIHDIVSTLLTSMHYPVYIVDIAMWTMYTQYRVDIVYIDVLSCLHRRHHDVNDVYTISCQHRLHRCTILFTSSTSRCERCIHDIVSTSFTSIYYHVDIIDIAMWTMYTQYRVNIFHIDVLSCFYRPYRRYRDLWNE